MASIISNCPNPPLALTPFFKPRNKVGWAALHIYLPSSTSDENMLLGSKMAKGQEESRRVSLDMLTHKLKY